MAKVTIEIPDEVYNSLRILAAAKGVSLDDFCYLAFIAGLNKNIRKKFPR